VSYWNLQAFIRFLYNSLINNKGTNYQLTAKRLGVLLLALAIYLPAEVLIWIGLALDELLFPGFHQMNLKEPVFIIGNPRSGTTFIQQLLARDTANFLTMRTWEIFGSPSITMRKIVRRVIKLSGSIGVRITHRVKRLERLWRESDRIHRLKLRSPEEDEYLFIHNFSTLKIWSFAAMVDEADPYIFFDQNMTLADKNRIMGFYESCLQRHFFFHQSSRKHYLSKNPNFSPAIDTLLRKFPDAKFIYMIRNPFQAVPSHISLKEREWQMLGTPLRKYACKDFIIKSSKHWYNYSLDKLNTLPKHQAAVIKLEDLIEDVSGTIHQLYQQLGLSVSTAFQEILAQETDRANQHQSEHQYSLSEMGISREYLYKCFNGVMDQFDYSH